ncbi:hypothetical protein VFPPC_13223 [Pochonia chlamydosporia 170]|uniref:Uncharacterized protein n=1 Tax=Pochonia chlamydosporia 170 TaxID=1380566 RepID=A0A179F6V5_METCM|nr:hypothetical protein VFPPC_13223 [Pochonia chlamydosporia 170]OAQ61195.1 hypothetical protein VFPPC_13223 [Pochonia chlamydosporia 170]
MAYYEEEMNQSYQDDLSVIDQGQRYYHFTPQHDLQPDFSIVPLFPSLPSDTPSYDTAILYAEEAFAGLDVDYFANDAAATMNSSTPFSATGQGGASAQVDPWFYFPTPPGSDFLGSESIPSETYLFIPGQNLLPEFTNLEISHPDSPDPWSTSCSPVSSTTTSCTTRQTSPVVKSKASKASLKKRKRGANTSARQTKAKATTAQPQTQCRGSDTPSPQRALQDQILLDGKKKGYSYKQILKTHEFGIAESTLRGRYRHLTQDAVQRVRNPQWLESDVTLLLQAVPLFRRLNGKPKVFWESVGKYILDHGGSRKFSGKTCHAKYTEQTGKHW